MGRLLHTEWYKLVHDQIFWAACAGIVFFNLLIFSGSSLWALPGQSALMEIMKKEIASAVIASIYGGVFLGGDFTERTFYHHLMIGKGRSCVLIAKSIVYAFATDVLLFLFPLLLVAVCSVRNGLGLPVSAATLPNTIGVIASLLLLGFAISAISLLAAVCFRDIGRTIGVPIVLYCMMILLLNSPDSLTFSRILPISLMILVADGTVSPAYGALLGTLWFVLLSAVSALIFRRAELR
jgi:ABC-2 type transport system permease protein